MSPARHEDGFILAATLWFVAVLTMVTSFLAFWAGSALEQTRQDNLAFQDELDACSTRSILLFLLATRSRSYGGLSLPLLGPAEEEEAAGMAETMEAETAMSRRSLVEEDGPEGADEGNDPAVDAAPREESGRYLAMDGRWYRGLGGIHFSLQDEGGLININNSKTRNLARLLVVLGVPADDVPALIDKLQDYIDEDNLHRLNGGEASQYLARNLPPPTNLDLRTPWEARNILDWRERDVLWKKDLLPRLTSVEAGYLINFNTSPWQVLQLLPGISEEEARRLVRIRTRRPFASLHDVERVVGRIHAVEASELAYTPGKKLRMTLSRPGAPRRRELRVQLTPMGLNRSPWLVGFDLSVPRPPEPDNEASSSEPAKTQIPGTATVARAGADADADPADRFPAPLSPWAP